ncbi:hypothetical protein PM082_013841 [Marasmius tenuissimus]|nr:hypothetical protein PM082_013841 [Marasmius tenuissimus]
MEHIQRRVPNLPGLRSLVSNLFISLLDEQLRTAMMLPAPKQWAKNVVWLVFGLRSYLINYLALPRQRPHGYVAAHDPPSHLGSDGRLRLFALVRQYYPWYYPGTGDDTSTFSQLRSLLRMRNENAPFVPGPEYKSEGYRIEELVCDKSSFPSRYV